VLGYMLLPYLVLYTMTYMFGPIMWPSSGGQNTKMNTLKVKLLKCQNQATHFNTLVCILLVLLLHIRETARFYH